MALHIPGINSEKCFVRKNIASVDIWPAEEALKIPDDWITKLGGLIRAPNLASYINEYKQKKQLEHGLKRCYALLTGDLAKHHPLFNISEDDKEGIRGTLAESVIHCREGTHDRVEELLTKFSIPHSLDELLAGMRFEMVLETARSMTSDVHEHNTVTVVANNMGFGIVPINSNDRYKGELSDTEIKKSLNETFVKNYRPLNILNTTMASLKDTLPRLGYTGKKTIGGYESGDYNKCKTFLDDIFGEHKLTEYFELDGESYEVRDIAWQNLKQMLWQKLTADGYFTLEEKYKNQINQLLQKTTFEGELSELLSGSINATDCVALASLLGLSDKQREQLYRLYLEKNTHSSEEFWKAVQVFWPKPGDEIILELNGRYPQHIAYLKQPQNLLKLPELLVNNGLSAPGIIQLVHRIHYLKQEERNQILRPQKNPWNTLMLVARFQPQALVPLLNVIKTLPPEDQAFIFKQADNNGWNALMIAAYYYPECITPLLGMIEKLSPADQVIIFKATNNGFNTLMMAAEHLPEAIPSLLKVIETFSLKDQAFIFRQRGANDWTPLKLAARRQPRAVIPLLQSVLSLEPAERVKLEFPSSERASAETQFVQGLFAILQHFDKKILILEKEPVKRQDKESIDKKNIKLVASKNFRDGLCEQFREYLKTPTPDVLKALYEKYQTLLTKNSKDLDIYHRTNIGLSVANPLYSFFKGKILMQIHYHGRRKVQTLLKVAAKS